MNKSVKFKDVFEDLITGEWGNECSDNKNGVFIIRTTNFTNEGIINFENVIKRNISQNKIKEKRLKEGDIIIEKSGGTDKTPVGRVVYCDKEIESNIYLCNNFTQVLRVNRTVANPKYIFYYMFYLHMKGITKLLQSKTTGIRNLQMNSYLNMKCVSPSLNEQKKIVYILNKVTSLVQLKKEQIKKYDIIKQSLFMEMFNDPIKNNMNWEVKKLKDLCLKIGSGATPKGGQSVYIDKGTSFIRSMNVYNGYFKYNGLAHINENHAQQLENVSLKENDILLNITGASVARSCIVPKNLLPARVNQHVALIRVNKEKINPIFLNHVFITDSFQKYLLNISASNGATRQAITKQQIEEFNIIVPSSKLVELYVKKVQQVDKSKFTNSYITLISIQNNMINTFFS